MSCRVLVFLLVSAILGSATSNEHHYSFYPCLQPRQHFLLSDIFVPPGGPTFRERTFPAVAERSLTTWVYMLSKKNSEARKNRLLWLFNRSWGCMSNGTQLTVVWKDAEDLIHADRELNVTNIEMLDRWTHLAFRSWENEAQIAINGVHRMTIYSFNPWVDFTGFFLGHTPTVAHPNPIQTESFFFNLKYYNYIFSDDELETNIALGSHVTNQLRPLNAENAMFQVHNTSLVLLNASSLPLSEGNSAALVEYWKSLDREIIFPPRREMVLNASTYLYYPCLPRRENSSLTLFHYQPIFDSFTRVQSHLLPPSLAEYSLAFHLSLDRVTNDDSDEWTMLFLVDCSWGLLTNGKALKVVWEESSLVDHVDRMLVIENVPLLAGPRGEGSKWTHVAARLWEREMQIYMDGKFVSAIIASPNVNHCGFVLGATPTVDRPKAPKLRALFYLFTYWNHIISDGELNNHLWSAPVVLPEKTPFERIVAADDFVIRAEGFVTRELLLQTGLIGLVVLLASLLILRESKAPVVVRIKVCSICLQSLENEQESALCQTCRKRATEATETANAKAVKVAKPEIVKVISEAEKEERRVRKQQQKAEALRQKAEAAERAREDREERLRLQKIVKDLRERMGEMERSLENVLEDKTVLKALLKEEREKIFGIDRDAQAWNSHLEECCRNEAMARAVLEPQLKLMEAIIKKEGVSAFLRHVYKEFPPKIMGAQLDLTASESRAVKLALAHYHPDKNDFDLHGLVWKHTCLEVTMLLNASRQAI